MIPNYSGEDKIRLDGVLKALPWGLLICFGGVFGFVVYSGAVFLVWELLNRLVTFLWSAAGLPEFCPRVWIAVVTLLPSAGLVLGLVLVFYRLRYTLGAKTVIDLKNCKSFRFSERFRFRNLQRIMFEHTLHVRYHNWREVIGVELNREVKQYIKSVYPGFEYKSPLKLGSSVHNFGEVLKLLERLDKDEINKKMPLFTESLRVTLTNLDNNQSLTRLLPPTHGFLYINKPFFSLDKAGNPKFFLGENFSVDIEYKGVRGYNFKLMVK